MFRLATRPPGVMPHVVRRLLRAAAEGRTCEYVIEYKSGRVLNIKKGILAASQRSGVHATPHMFRHSAAVWMAEDRTPI